MHSPDTGQKGVFTLSVDFELIWGTLDLFGPARFASACTEERTTVRRLLTLLEEYEISATWCVVGHLMLESCREIDGRKHPEIVRPRHPWQRGDWFEHDPTGDEASAPLSFARSLIEEVGSLSVRQGIGSHSFSHVIFGEPGCSAQTARSELQACVAAAKSLDLELKSFVFPRNSVGHLEILKEHGFACYRGPGLRWYEPRGSDSPLRRLGHLMANIGAITPVNGRPTETLPGLCDPVPP